MFGGGGGGGGGVCNCTVFSCFGAQVCLTLILERKGGYMASSLNLGPS